MTPQDRLVFALDLPNAEEIERYVDLLEEHVGAFKVGLEAYIETGRLPKTRRPVILDLKCHDIPETVARAVKRGGDRGAKYMTLHVQQRAALEAAVKAAEEYKITLLGVTVLTSMTVSDLNDLDIGQPDWLVGKVVKRRAEHGYGCGLRGFVCSPLEARALHELYPDATLLVPGIRPAGADAGDQKRTGTPRQAVEDGATLLVVGRPIRDAVDPVEAAKSIVAEIPA